jgi:hypothetical protein
LRIENVEALHPSGMVMLGPHILNSPSQSTFEDEKNPISVNIPTNFYFQIFNHFNDFNVQETILVYDSYDDQVLLNCDDHDCFSQVHDLSAFNFDETCENESNPNYLVSLV